MKSRSRLISIALLAIQGLQLSSSEDPDVASSQDALVDIPAWDDNGYVLFCLCMGRFGNQMEHFLGGLEFAKKLNRTLLLPPFHTYRNVRFTDYVKIEPLQVYHRVMVAEDFLQYFGDSHWPKGKRYAMCWMPRNMADKGCSMKDGSPFGPFWEGLGVDFDRSFVHDLSYSDPDSWHKKYPSKEFPVIALKGAPAPFPMSPSNWHLQQYIELSEEVTEQGDDYINKHFPDEKFIGIHLRNGVDWKRACGDLEPTHSYMAGLQCSHNTKKLITKETCYPSPQQVLRKLREAVESTGITVIFVATDKDPMIKDITEELNEFKVKVYHADPWLPLVDWAILIKSDLFIGNCVSSFSSFVKRSRDVDNKPTSYFAFD